MKVSYWVTPLVIILGVSALFFINRYFKIYEFGSDKKIEIRGIYGNPNVYGARRRNLGLDYSMLKKFVDVFSPMVYHARMGRSAEWVKDNIEWFCQNLNIRANKFPKVWPIVQCYNEPYVISAQEFEKVLRYGLSSEATGVMMFTSVAVAEDQEKTETMKSVYSKL